jgi:hypothetical protein
MSMIEVEAIKNFEHDGPRRRGDKFFVTPSTARTLKSNGLISAELPVNPPLAAGEQSSASPAAQASQNPMSKLSAPGAMLRRIVASLQSIQRFVQRRGRT